MSIRWREPQEVVTGRERFWNKNTPRGVLVLTVACAAICATVLFVGGWLLVMLRSKVSPLLLAIVGAVIGSIVGFCGAVMTRERVLPQEVELREEDFSVWDEKGLFHCDLRYDQLRGYFLFQFTDGEGTYRLLMLYPQDQAALSLGLPDTVSDEQIRALIGDRSPYGEIVDEVAIQRPQIHPA